MHGPVLGKISSNNAWAYPDFVYVGCRFKKYWSEGIHPQKHISFRFVNLLFWGDDHSPHQTRP